MALQLHNKRSSKRRRAVARHRRFAVGITVTILIIVSIWLLIGIAYIWYMGQYKPVQPAALPEKTVSKPVETPAPTTTPTGPVGVASQVFTNSVVQGGNASLTIRTRPEAACSITVTYDDRKSTDTGLLPKTADEFGTAQWTWTVESSRPVGTWPVEVTCGLGEESGYLKLKLEVTSASG